MAAWTEHKPERQPKSTTIVPPGVDDDTELEEEWLQAAGLQGRNCGPAAAGPTGPTQQQCASTGMQPCGNGAAECLSENKQAIHRSSEIHPIGVGASAGGAGDSDSSSERSDISDADMRRDRIACSPWHNSGIEWSTHYVSGNLDSWLKCMDVSSRETRLLRTPGTTRPKNSAPALAPQNHRIYDAVVAIEPQHRANHGRSDDPQLPVTPGATFPVAKRQEQPGTEARSAAPNLRRVRVGGDNSNMDETAATCIYDSRLRCESQSPIDRLHGTAPCASRWMHTAMDMGLARMRGPLLNALRSWSHLQDYIRWHNSSSSSCERATDRLCWGCLLSSWFIGLLECTHFLGPLISCVMTLIAVSWIPSELCVTGTVRHHAGDLGFASVDDLVVANSSLANDTLQLSLVQCGLSMDDYTFLNATMQEVYDYVLAPTMSHYMPWVWIGPVCVAATIVVSVLATFVCGLAGHRGVLVPSSVSLLWCPCWMIGIEDQQPLHVVVNGDRLDVLHSMWVYPVWQQIQRQHRRYEYYFCSFVRLQVSSIAAQCMVPLHVAGVAFIGLYLIWFQPAWWSFVESPLVDCSEVVASNQSISQVATIGCYDGYTQSDADPLQLSGWLGIAAGMATLIGVFMSVLFQVLQMLAVVREDLCCFCFRLSRPATREAVFRGLTRPNLPGVWLGGMGLTAVVAGVVALHAAPAVDDMDAVDDSIARVFLAGCSVLLALGIIRLVAVCCRCGTRYASANAIPLWVAACRPFLNWPEVAFCIVQTLYFSGMVAAIASSPDNAAWSVWSMDLSVFVLALLAIPVYMYYPFKLTWGSICLCICPLDLDKVRGRDPVSASQEQITRSMQQVLDEVGVCVQYDRTWLHCCRCGLMCSASSQAPVLSLHEAQELSSVDTHMLCDAVQDRIEKAAACFRAELARKSLKARWRQEYARQYAYQKYSKAPVWKPSQLEAFVRDCSPCEALEQSQGATSPLHWQDKHSQVQSSFERCSLYALSQAGRGLLDYGAMQPGVDMVSRVVELFVYIEALAGSLRQQVQLQASQTVVPLDGKRGSGIDEVAAGTSAAGAATAAAVGLSRDAGTRGNADESSSSGWQHMELDVGSRTLQEMLDGMDAVLDSLMGAYVAIEGDSATAVRFLERKKSIQSSIVGINGTVHASEDVASTTSRAEAGVGAGSDERGPRGARATSRAASVLSGMDALLEARRRWDGPQDWSVAGATVLVDLRDLRG